MRTRTLLFPLALIVLAGMYVTLEDSSELIEVPPSPTQTAAVSMVTAPEAMQQPILPAPPPAPTSTPATTTPPKKSITKLSKSSAPTPQPQAPQETGQVAQRITNPYQTPALSADALNAASRGALVNILCQPRGGGSLRPMSGSGVMIDPRGVILTNAHVAQFVLLSEDSAIDLSCVIRTGSPASPTWTASVLYIPPAWVRAHVSEVNAEHPKGTGEHDYALLYVLGGINGAPRPNSFTSLPYDTRHAIGFVDDSVLVAAYPAEFAGGLNVLRDLYAASSVTTIKELMTLSGKNVDIVALGGTITAQGGSSGGAVVNAWGRLIGLVVTTSAGATTADRSLHALTMYYVNKDLLAQTGSDLPTFLAGDLNQKLADFDDTAETLVNLYKKQLSH